MTARSTSDKPLPLVDWVKKVKAEDLVRRKCRTRVAALVGSTGLLLATEIWPPPPLLVWNVSPSAPMGLYRLSPSATIRAGDMAVTWVPPVARELAAQRYYLPSNVPLVKQVAAIEGDRVCAIGTDISVNGKWIVSRRIQDGKGRLMPRWQGCSELFPGDLFMIARDQPQAFDGRYFGVTRARYVVGKAVLIWQR